jgi:hypothetical protein
MGLQAVHSFELASPMMLELISDITLADRSHVITVFAHGYLHQREALTGGDGKIEIDGRSFAVWRHSPRPLTAIEGSLYSWLKDESRPVAQQIAAQTLAVLATTELERWERAPFQKTPSAWPQTAQPQSSHAEPAVAEWERVHKLLPLGRLSLLAALPRKKEVRTQVWPLMAQVIEMQQHFDKGRTYRQIVASLRSKNSSAASQAQEGSATIVPMVLQRWRTFGDEGVNTLAHGLSRALEVYRYRWLILALLLISYMVACNAVQRLKVALSQPSSPPEIQQPATADQETHGNR